LIKSDKYLIQLDALPIIIINYEERKKTIYTYIILMTSGNRFFSALRSSHHLQV